MYKRMLFHRFVAGTSLKSALKKRSSTHSRFPNIILDYAVEGSEANPSVVEMQMREALRSKSYSLFAIKPSALGFNSEKIKQC